MPAWLLPLALSGVSALSGLLSNRKKQAESTTNQRTVTDINQLSMPEYDEQTRAMRDTLMQQYLGQLSDNTDYFRGYQTEGLSNLNRSNDIANRSIENILASRGLSGTTAGVTSAIQSNINRLNQQGSFLNSIPLLRDQRYQNLLGSASGFFKGLPTGTRLTGQNVSNMTGTGQSTSPGNPWGGAIGGLSNALMGFYGEGAFSPKKTGPVGPTGYDLSRPDETAPQPNIPWVSQW